MLKPFNQLSAKIQRLGLKVLGLPHELAAFHQNWHALGGGNSELVRLSEEMRAIKATISASPRHVGKTDVTHELFKYLAELKNKQYRYADFYEEFNRYHMLAMDAKRILPADTDVFPCLDDKTPSTGFDRHYLYHPIWALRKLKEIKPKKHVDISSTLFFSAAASLFCDIEFHDYRPADIELPNLKCGRADLLKLEFADGSIASLSCMHVIEHIGLGRYGDPIDPSGDIKAAHELTRVLGPNGDLLIVLPFGRPKVAFNAHRIYSLEDVKDLFGELTLKEFTLISEDPSDGGLITNPDEDMLAKQAYGCGCFWFRKE